jgi:4-carboxymuconolactone decarboxylase
MAGEVNESPGAARRRLAQGAKADRLQGALADLDPTLARWADDFIFGDVWAGEALSHEERMLVAITALATLNRPNQLRNYLHGALQSGTPPAKLQEALKMLVVYAGFPAAIGALVELQSALEVHGRTP